MKNPLLVALVALAGCLSAATQGTLNFNNGAAGINYPVYTPAGLLAQSADGIYADLYYGATAGSVTTPRGLQVQVGTLSAGYFNGLSPGNINGGLPIPGTVIGGSVFVKIVVWQGGSSYATATISKAESPVRLVQSLDGGEAPAPSIPLGDGSLVLIAVPEPPVFALAALGFGGLGLLMLRQRRSK